MLHWSDAQEYIKRTGGIDGYLKSNIKTYKKHIDEFTKEGYNAYQISRYAKRSLAEKRYDEVYTEFRTLQKLKGR